MANDFDARLDSDAGKIEGKKPADLAELDAPAPSVKLPETGGQGIADAAAEYVSSLFQNNSGGHDVAHTMRVYRNALLIAAKEPPCDMELVALAALLHDADDHKLFHTENNANARCFLESRGVGPERINQICQAINSVSFSQNRGKRPATAEGKIVQDADRLDAIGAVGIARTFAFGGEHGRSLGSSIQHFYEKLLLLKEEMNTETARKIAEERHAFMLAFLKEFESETKQSGDLPEG